MDLTPECCLPNFDPFHSSIINSLAAPIGVQILSRLTNLPNFALDRLSRYEPKHIRRPGRG
jgi:hypothetical protein